MKFYIYGVILFLSFTLVSCAKRERTAIEIGKISVSAEEFNRAFKKSPYQKESGKGRRQFLDRIIDKKLILSEAENLGLNKDPHLLQDLQLFWEQALLKLTLEYKSRELLSSIKIGDEEMERYFKENIQPQYSSKTFSEMKEAIKKILAREKQNELILEWIESLRNKAAIHIDYDQLGIPKPEGR